MTNIKLKTIAISISKNGNSLVLCLFNNNAGKTDGYAVSESALPINGFLLDSPSIHTGISCKYHFRMISHKYAHSGCLVFLTL